MHRRDFIRVLGGGAIFAATACAPAGSDPRAAWVNPGAGETDIRRKALSFAILAPNPHNMQPWIVDLSVPDEITLYIDRARLLPVTDPFNRQITIGCGAFLELLQMALGELGYSSLQSPFPAGDPAPRLDSRPILRVFGIRKEVAPNRWDPLFAHVLKRRTNRGQFSDKAVTSEDLKVLTATMFGGPMAEVVASTGNEQIARLRSLVYEGARIEAHTPAAHHESVERTFIGTRDVAAHPWGISLDQPTMTAMNAVGILTKPKMARSGTIAYDESLKFLKTAADTARGFVWVKTIDDSRQSQLDAGEAYVRVNLAAASLGLAMHPWSQGLQEYASQKPVYDALHKELAPDGGRIQMLARIGYPKAEVPPAPRRGLAAQLRKT